MSAETTTAPGLVLAAPASASGKTLVTLAALRAYRQRGVAVAAAKAGPDYIDPGFHARAGGGACFNLDPWSMRPETLRAVAARAGAQAELLLIEGVMGLFDGARDGSGSTADLAALFGWPVVLVVDAKGRGSSIAADVLGFHTFRADLGLAGVIFNRVGGAAQRAILQAAMAGIAVPVLGYLPEIADLRLPSRHLGLVQAAELGDLECLLDCAATWIATALDLARLRALARPARLSRVGGNPGDGAALPPLGQRIALARDAAFAFAYPHLIESWRTGGAEILPFSPLADEAPDRTANAVFLPGGYPELHAGRLAANRRFLDGLRARAAAGATIYGECGGYMALGQGMIDRDGRRHEMAGLLPIETSFAAPKRHLGYRAARLIADGPLGAKGTTFRGHEFHYASVTREGGGAPLFTARDAVNSDLGATGRRVGRVLGSFLHLVDRA